MESWIVFQIGAQVMLIQVHEEFIRSFVLVY